MIKNEGIIKKMPARSKISVYVLICAAKGKRARVRSRWRGCDLKSPQVVDFNAVVFLFAGNRVHQLLNRIFGGGLSFFSSVGSNPAPRDCLRRQSGSNDRAERWVRNQLRLLNGTESRLVKYE